MQLLSDEFHKLIAERLKLGDTKPTVRVEVDRLAFIPGRVQELSFIVGDFKSKTRVIKTWIDQTETGSYDGKTTLEDETFVFPVEGHTTANVSSHFGASRPGGRKHGGTDVACKVGCNVLACWSGVVVKAVKSNALISKGGGYYVSVRHNNGRLTKYMHLNDILVSVGQKVSPGEVIGISGNTGFCISNGKVVDSAMRAEGRGAHLHFEVWEDVTEDAVTGKEGKGHKVNPYAYMIGEKKAYLGSSNTGGGVQEDGAVEGYLGEVKLHETFDKRKWNDDEIYIEYTTFDYYSSNKKDSEGSWHEFMFGTNRNNDPGYSPGEAVITGFSSSVNMTHPGVLSFGFRTNFKNADGDEVRVFINDVLVRRIVDFNDSATKMEVTGVAIPEGDIKIRLEARWGGKDITGDKGTVYKQVAFNYVKVQELNATPPANDKSPGSLDPTIHQESYGYWENLEVEDFIYNEKNDAVPLQLGDFVYTDTMVLENIQSCEVNCSLEQEASEANLTISNPNGIFSPDYSPFNFPELFHSSPWSYRVNGFQVGVLSENTPIRIYLGYGDKMVRVFTGLIDKVDEVGQDAIMTLTARDMYKKIIGKVLTEEKAYPDVNYVETTDDAGTGYGLLTNTKVAWLKTAVIQDLIEHAGMFGWRANSDDLYYPDAVIEESYLIEVNQQTGKVIRAIPNKEGEFEVADVTSIPSPQGWLNPFTEEYGKTFYAYKQKVSECVNDVLKDTNYWSHCDRYGTYRLEKMDYFKPIVGEFSEHENLISINKSTDFSRGRSHIVVFDSEGKYANFIDKEILMELKGELRTTVVDVPWAKTLESKREVAKRMFYDMKRLCRTLQVSVPGNPSLDLLDRVWVVDKNTSTRAVYTIKGIRHSYNVDSGYLNVIDLTWSQEGAVV